MILFTKISKITSPFRKYSFEIFLGFKMALLKYLKRVDAKKPIKINNVLLKPDGPLSSVMPMSLIESTNVAVKKVMLTASCVTKDDEIDKRRETYQHFTSKEKLGLGKRAAKLGISSTVRYFTVKSGEERTLSPSTLFAWKEK